MANTALSKRVNQSSNLWGPELLNCRRRLHGNNNIEFSEEGFYESEGFNLKVNANLDTPDIEYEETKDHDWFVTIQKDKFELDVYTDYAGTHTHTIDLNVIREMIKKYDEINGM